LPSSEIRTRLSSIHFVIEGNGLIIPLKSFLKNCASVKSFFYAETEKAADVIETNTISFLASESI